MAAFSPLARQSLWPWLLALLGLALGAAAFLASMATSGGLRASEQDVLAAQPARAVVATGDVKRMREHMLRAEAEARQAQAREAAFRERAEKARARAERSAHEAAALAAAIQQSEAQLAANEARLDMIESEKSSIEERLAARRQPLAELVGALQNISRRPVVLSLLSPGSLEQAVYLRAVLEASLPDIARRTSQLRRALARVQRLERAAREHSARMRAEQARLDARRAELARLNAAQLAISREAAEQARRESLRALELGEQTRDLDALVTQLDRSARLRERLAALPGPLLRPPRPSASQVVILPQSSTLAPQDAAKPAALRLQMPVIGEIALGYGEALEDGSRSRQIEIAARPEALLVAPAEGRVAFAGPYRGYGTIVIIEHGPHWTSILTGLERVQVRPGQALVAGAPIGSAPRAGGRIGFELRRGGEPVNPIDFL